MYQPISTEDDSGSRASSPSPSHRHNRQREIDSAKILVKDNAVPSSLNSSFSSSSSSSGVSSGASSSDSTPDACASAASNSRAVGVAESDFHVKLVLIGSAPLTVSCTLDTKLIHLKRRLFAQQLVDLNKDVRMIYLGRVLKDDELTLKQLNVENGHAIHAFITDKDKDKDAQSNHAITRAHSDGHFTIDGGPSDYLRGVSGVPLHRSATDTDTDYGSGSGAGYSYGESDSTRLGGVRVVPAGRVLVSELDGDVNVVHGGEEYVWVAERRGGDTLDLICGFALGIFLGPLSLIWMLNRQLPFRQKTGILFGIMANLTLYFWSGNQQAQQAANNAAP